MELKIEGVEFSYSSTPVLHDISVELTGPKFVCILGPNGVGKSTLIHCINKILTPTVGTVFIDGKDVKEITVKELAKHVGYVPYSANDTFPLSVVDTVLMGRHPHSKWKSLDNDLDIVYDVLHKLGISHLAMRSFSELSAGQHQKVMLARGLVRTPKIVLLDEPTSNLDIKHQIDVTKTLSLLPKAKGMLVIMISHDINITAKYADRIIMLAGGGIFADGTPKEVLTKENIRTVYGVDADVIDVNGRPHIILNDCLDDAYIPTDLGPVD